MRTQGLRQDEASVTDVLGTILLVAITVAATVGFNMLILNIPGPEDLAYADLAMETLPGPDGEYGTGDEQIQARHLWGEALDQEHTSFLIEIDGTTEVIQGSSLGFPSGKLQVGDEWTATRSIGQDEEVTFAVVHASDSSGILFQETKTARHERCLLDLRGPSAVLTQAPQDISAAHGSGVATITAVLSDLCSGVADVAPMLHYSIGTGSPITMTKVSGTTYTADIPAPGGDWSTSIGQTLDYHLEDMTDASSNTASSPDFTDYIQSTAPGFVFVGDPTLTVGSASNWDNAKAMDDSAHGTLTTAATGSSGSYTLNANEVVSAHVHWGDQAKADSQSDQGPKYKKSIGHPIVLGLENPPGSPGSITGVTIHVRQYIKDGYINDGWRIGACILESCSAVSQVIDGSAAWTTIQYDVTDLRPGGGPWRWSDLDDLRVKLSTHTNWDATNKNGYDGEWIADHVYTVIDYGPGQGLDVQATFSSVPASGDYTLEARYRASVDQFQISAWDGSQWQVKSPMLADTQFTTWATSLSASEYNGGNPLIRIESVKSQPTMTAQIHFDYLLVRS